MNFRRYLHPDSILLELETTPTPPDDEMPEPFEPEGPRNVDRVRQGVFVELTQLFAATGQVAKTNRLERDLYEREKKAVTALGQGLAIPHVRTLQVKSFVMAFARSTPGLPFGAPDEEPVHLFFAMAAPPYDDRLYLRVYRDLARVLLDPELIRGFLAAEAPDEILYLLKNSG